MTYFPTFIRLLPWLAGIAAAEPTDLLRLSDGSLEGHFAGIDRGGMLHWSRDDAGRELEFRLDKVRHIALRGAQPSEITADLSHVSLVNGDRLPGRIASLDDRRLELATDFAGTLEIPRSSIESLKPNPFGGRLIYAGPFDGDGWETIDPQSDDPERYDDDEDGERAAKGPTWRRSGGYWYYTGGAEALRRQVGLPRKSVFRFHLDWKSRAPLSIGFFADFAVPPAAEDVPAEADQPPPRRPDLSTAAFGNSLVLTLRSSYVTLQRCGYDAESGAFSRMVQTTATTVRFENHQSADFELRSDLDEGTVTLFVDGSYALQWNVADDLDGADLGSGIGFLVPGNPDAMRLSDILIAEWNGMPDAARSLRHPERDLVLLTNGTDRFSGKITGIAGGQLSLAGSYADLTVPLDQVAEVHFAPHEQAEPASGADDPVKILFQPVGRISGEITEADATRAVVRSPLLGELQVGLAGASLLEFKQEGQFLSNWDDDL
ncbi:hypothetical protein [Haloferula sargassicola]|uniref:Uncharacterized protein n=1 Tax=Haloferula sargassicola TaxID=490096 RepID=A0ABP9UVQ5_9BACT